MSSLTGKELANLVRSVFPRFPEDRILAVLVDVPQDPAADNKDWKARRALAYEWAAALKQNRADIPVEDVRLYAYPDVRSNNADLPAEAFLLDGPPPDAAAELGRAGLPVAFARIFAETQLFLAPTEFSTTAPLKVAAKRFGFRAATMPGFSTAMVPALRVDYGDVARRVEAIRARLEAAAGADVKFLVDGALEYAIHFDLRFRPAHGSSGRFPEKGTAGNLPSGEAYIVPYEGEKGEPSGTEGILPVEIGGEVVLFHVAANKAVHVYGEGSAASAERERLGREPAYGNMAELGFGVLADFGLAPVGEVLLDEKLGLHVAFGRSEHFGGAVGPKDFSSPSEVVHLDRIYIPAAQPRVGVVSVVLAYPDGRREEIIDHSSYTIF
ncbi:MAG: hypothetical protein FJY80_14690 [Candidatus Aminicenantes bacterium]|nr:hypothetical protein [Candidatus Aminicenantes bacterium]